MNAIDFQMLFDLNTDAMLIINESGRIVQANPSFYRLTKYTEAHIVGHRYVNFLQFDTEQWQVSSEDQRLQLVCLDSTCIPVLIRQNAGHDETYSFVIIKNMQPLDEVAEHYLNSELRFRMITENIQDVLILMDRDKNYLYVSPSAAEMFKFDASQLDNRTAFFNIHPNDVPTLERLFNEALYHGTPFTLKCKAWHGEKGWIWTEMSGKAVLDERQQFKHMLLVARDISQQQKYEENLLHYAYYDALTHLPNRRKLIELMHEIVPTLSAAQPYTIMVMDIDHFKQMNDSYGHEIGDAILVEFSRRIERCLPKHGIVGRLGGDEFVVLVPTATLQQGIEIAARIVRVMEQPIEIQHACMTITASIGVTFATKPTTVSQLLREADEALYEVKASGKNQYQVYIP